MTVTYNLSTAIGQVRLLIGDKVIADPVFTNEELQVFLTSNGDSINLASAQALEAWAASYGANPDNEAIGDYSYRQDVVNKMLTLAKRLRDNDSVVPVADYAEMDLENYGDTEESEG